MPMSPPRTGTVVIDGMDGRNSVDCLRPDFWLKKRDQNIYPDQKQEPSSSSIDKTHHSSPVLQPIPEQQHSYNNTNMNTHQIDNYPPDMSSYLRGETSEQFRKYEHDRIGFLIRNKDKNSTSNGLFSPKTSSNQSYETSISNRDRHRQRMLRDRQMQQRYSTQGEQKTKDSGSPVMNFLQSTFGPRFEDRDRSEYPELREDDDYDDMPNNDPLRTRLPSDVNRPQWNDISASENLNKNEQNETSSPTSPLDTIFQAAGLSDAHPTAPPHPAASLILRTIFSVPRGPHFFQLSVIK